MTSRRLEIKVCGLTSPAAAIACVAVGADAIGMVFHPGSPRNLLPAQAREIAADLPQGVARVGVFVDQSTEEIVRLAAQVGLDTVQLHCRPGLHPYPAFALHRLHVVQVLRSTGDALLAQARALPSEVGVLVECGSGTLPGGNGAVWNWGAAAALREVRPFAIAGGLDPANVAHALAASGASGVDVSSSVEGAPGVKDLHQVALFVAAVRASGAHGTGRVFHPAGTAVAPNPEDRPAERTASRNQATS